MRATLAFPLLLAAALAGCGDTHRPPADHGGDGGPTGTVAPEPDSAVFQVAFRASAGATVEVPFPHLDACVQPGDWMNGTAEAQGVVPALRDASEGRTGRVLELTAPAAGEAQWESRLDLAAHPPCQTLRFDPWSTEPEPQGDSVDVLARGEVSELTVLVRLVRGGCGNATLHEGTAQDGSWSTLAGRTIPAGCA